MHIILPHGSHFVLYLLGPVDLSLPINLEALRDGESGLRKPNPLPGEFIVGSLPKGRLTFSLVGRSTGKEVWQN